MKNNYFKYVVALAMTGFLSVGWMSQAFAQNFVTIGTGTSTSSQWSAGETPFGTYYHDDRTQLLYTSSELIAAGASPGDLLTIGFEVANAAGQAMNGFNIKMKNTSTASLSGWESGLTTVYSNTSQSMSNGWNDFALPIPFNWNGTDNLLVEICFDNSSYTTSTQVYQSSVSGFTANQSRYYDFNTGCTISTNPYTYTNRVNTRFDFAPPVANSAGVLQVDTPYFGACALDSTLYVSIKNSGTDTLTSATVNWLVNGVAQPSFSWTGTLAPLSNSAPLYLGDYNFVDNDQLTVWTTMPNGVPDSLSMDDSLLVDLHTALNGTYTIDLDATTNPDYLSFNDAVDALNQYGVCGPVTFLVADTTYNEQLPVEEVFGMSSVNTVTFESASGNNTGVVLTYSATSGGDNYVVDFKGGDHFTFKNMTLENLGSSNSRVVVFGSGASHNTIEGCVLTAPTTTSSYSNNRAVVYSNSQGNDANSIIDNVINNGCYGVYFYGNSGDYNKGLKIVGNEILGSYQYGVYTYYQEDLELNDNLISSSNTYLFSYGMSVYYTVEGEIVNNFVDDSGAAYYYGMYLYSMQGSLNKWANVSGNRVKFDYYGLYFSQGLFGVVSNNTIFAANSASSSSRALYVTGGSVNQVFNNNVSNGAGGYAYYLSGNPIHISDNNNFYSSGTNAFYAGSNHSDLASFVAAVGHDTMSLSVMNSVADSATLKVCTDSLDGKGMQTAYSLMDFEGDLRDGNTPDIGADEFASLSSFSLGDDVTLCDGDSLTLSMFYYDTIAWSNGDTGNYLVVTSPASYTVSVNGICGAATDTIVVNAQVQSQLAATENLCVGQTSTLDPGIPNGVYSWSTGDNTATLDVNAAGTYEVTIVDEFGCMSTSSTSVSQSVAVNLDSLYEYCAGASAFLDAAVSGTYSWSDGSAGQTLNVTSPGTYTVTVTDPFNCVTSDQAVVEEIQLPLASFGDSISYYTVIVTNMSANGTSYLWDFGDGNTSTDENPAAHVYGWGSGTYTVSLTVTNQCGSDTYTSDVYIDQDTNTSVNDVNLAENVKVYPNPTEGLVNLNIVSVVSSEVSYQVVDMTGSLLYSNKAVSMGGNFNDVLDLSSYAKGVYFVKVTVGDQFMVQKITLR